ncbi:thiamine phosphate synthase [Eubacterium sp. MSJ-13]|uniref:thiamine phosphate synthase n=1 Tax=Eubacterium sp. MSJ-13 TaxID=2841513 RepID=UPI001C10885D|nr:thiamine phosphate synthase [Eubacterium sp. MSJ-13]MBU5478847.1 thiamine phosphate synthase [Eubacterium sp. MSJ-13]
MKVTRESMLVYAITDRHWTGRQTLEQQVEEILKNGATFLQIREKNMPHDELVKEAVRIKEIAKKYNIPVVIDDDIYAVIESGADGVHIGQKDMDYIEARKLLGNDKIIGMTAPSVELAKKAEKLGADYIGAGAVFSTSTKKDTKPLELSTLKEICNSVSIPVVAIGGIDHSNVRKLEGTDIDGIAVISALFGAKDCGKATRELVSIMNTIFPKKQ